MLVYIFNILLGCLFIHFANDKKLWFIPFAMVLFIWTFIAGGQNGIGTDYYDYKDYFESLWGNSRFELLFRLCSTVLYDCGIRGQGQFYFYAALNFIIIFFVGRKLGIRHWGIFYFLIIVVSTFFHNQMNMVRQAVACGLVFAALTEHGSKPIKPLILIALASGFHRTALVFLPFVLFPKWIDRLVANPQRLLIISLVIALIPIPVSINHAILRYTRFLFGDYYYMHYMGSAYAMRTVPFSSKIVKLLLWPFFMWAVKKYQSDSNCTISNNAFMIGVLSYCLWIVLLVTPMTARISYYFMLPSMIPLYYLFSDLYDKKRQYVVTYLPMIFLLSIYLAKIYVGKGEYASSFVFL